MSVAVLVDRQASHTGERGNFHSFNTEPAAKVQVASALISVPPVPSATDASIPPTFAAGSGLNDSVAAGSLLQPARTAIDRSRGRNYKPRG